jgi:endonuclease YncB( thermonuclease family)
MRTSRRDVLLIVALLGGVQLGFQAAPEEPAPPTEQPLVEVTVNRVIDGDTLDAQIDGIRTPVGYLGAETPLPNQPCGQEAFARNLELAGEHVLLQADTSFDGLDQRRRRLFYAYTLEGVSIDETLVYEGLARAPRVESAHGALLSDLETDARDNARGCLWATS